MCDSGSGGKSEKDACVLTVVESSYFCSRGCGLHPLPPELLPKCPRGGLFVFSEVTFSHKAGTLYRHVCSMLTRVIDWRVGAGTEVTRPAIAYTASVIVIRISNLVILVRNELYSKSSTALGKNHTASE